MVFYYAYGSNMSEQRMLDRKITFFSRKFGILKNYKLPEYLHAFYKNRHISSIIKAKTGRSAALLTS